jgi:AcrR family transcriptional regulator
VRIQRTTRSTTTAPRAGRTLLAKEERREAILRAAATAFAGAGFAATSMEDVAAACGITKLIVYRHFDSKEELYRAVLEQVSQRQVQVFLDNVLDGSQSLGLRTFLSVAREHPDGFVLLWRHAYREPQFAAYAREFREKAVDVARTPLAGVLGDHPALARWAPEAVIDSMVSEVLAWLEHGDPAADEELLAVATAGLRALDEHARWSLDVRNIDHVVAAMEAGLVGDVLAIGRSRPAGALPGPTWTDRRGGVHRLATAPSLAHVADGFGGEAPSPHAEDAAALLAASGPVLLDLDLDCFTTPSDADPTTILPWPADAIREFLFPDGAAAFWDAVLPRCAALTLAREPLHVGSLIAAGRLFETAAPILFGELLGTGLP